MELMADIIMSTRPHLKVDKINDRKDLYFQCQNDEYRIYTKYIHFKNSNYTTLFIAEKK